MLLKIVPYYLAQGGSAFNKNAKIISSFLRQMNVFFHFSDHKNKMMEKVAYVFFCRPVLVIGKRRKHTLKWARDACKYIVKGPIYMFTNIDKADELMKLLNKNSIWSLLAVLRVHYVVRTPLSEDIGYKEFIIIWVQMSLFFEAYPDLNLVCQFELKDSDIKW